MDDSSDDNRSTRQGLRGSRRTRRLLRDLHQRTGELELLISGAVALALAFLPRQVDRIYYGIEAQLVGTADIAAFFGFYYLKLILYLLIVTFGAHLVVRAFWVAMVGLDSTYPRGVRWTQLSNGPISRGIFRRMLPSTREMIVYSDGVASVIFAAGFSVVAIFAVSIVGAGLLAGVALAASRVLPFDFAGSKIFGFSAIGFAIVFALPVLVDSLIGKRLVTEGGAGRVERTLGWMIRWSTTLVGFRIYGPIQLTLSSQLGGKVYGASIATVIGLVLTFFIVNDALVQGGTGVLITDPWQPVRVGEFGVNPRHYEDRPRPEARLQLVPTVPTEIMDEETNWLRIFVPGSPSRDVEALKRSCPDIDPPEAAGFQTIRRRSVAPLDSVSPNVERALDCVSGLWEVRVDGRLATDPVFYRNSRTGLKGLAWYVDLREFPPGRHTVEVARAAGVDIDPAWTEEERSEEAERPPLIYRFPVWN